MKVIKHQVITDYEEIQRLVKCPEIEYLEFGIFEHNGHRIEITVDNVQQYANVDGGYSYVGKSVEDVFRWVGEELNGR